MDDFSESKHNQTKGKPKSTPRDHTSTLLDYGRFADFVDTVRVQFLDKITSFSEKQNLEFEHPSDGLAHVT